MHIFSLLQISGISEAHFCLHRTNCIGNKVKNKCTVTFHVDTKALF